MKLSNENIDDVITEIEKFFESLKVSKKDRVKICFLLEESLLRFQEKFGEDHDFDFVTKKWFGTPKVLIRVKGKPYNPIEDNSEENIFSESVIQNLLNYEQAGTVYRYENGRNEISAFSTREVKKLKIPGGSFTIAILLAILSALIVQNFSPSVQQNIVEYIVAPVLDKLLGLIVACSIPMIFISIVASICSIENVTMLNEVGGKILKRFFVIMFSISVTSIFVNVIFFPVVKFDDEVALINATEAQKIFDLFLNMLPQNIIEPFLQGNILQIIVMALVTGIIITTLGDRVSGFKDWIMNLRKIIFRIVKVVFEIMPLIIFLCIFKIMLEDSPAEILSVWKIIAVNYIVYLLICGTMFLRIKINHGVEILDFLKKIYPAFLISFTTSSGTASMTKNIEICKENLHVEKNFCELYIPLSHALCPTTRIIGITSCVFFAAEFSSAQISIANLFIIAFLSIQFSLSQKGSGGGGMLAILGLLFTQLGLSLDAIGPVTVADIFVVNISGVVAMIIRDCDLIDMSHKIKLSNEK